MSDIARAVLDACLPKHPQAAIIESKDADGNIIPGFFAITLDKSKSPPKDDITIRKDSIGIMLLISGGKEMTYLTPKNKQQTVAMVRTQLKL